MGKSRKKVIRDELKAKLERAFRKQFPRDTVDISDGYQDLIHVLVVSRKFDGMGEKEKQQFLWRVIDKMNLAKDEEGLISLLLPVSPTEIK